MLNVWTQQGLAVGCQASGPDSQASTSGAVSPKQRLAASCQATGPEGQAGTSGGGGAQLGQCGGQAEQS